MGSVGSVKNVPWNQCGEDEEAHGLLLERKLVDVGEEITVEQNLTL